MTLTPLSALLARREHRGREVAFDIPQDWAQGRTSFGGLVSALAVQAMRDVAGPAWPAQVALRALQTNFISPVASGRMTVSVQLLREGRNVRQVQATVQQEGALAALIVGVFGGPRETTLPPLEPARPAAAHAVEDIPAVPFVPGLRPNFVAHLDIRWSEGTPPFSGTPGWRSSLHVRLVDPDAAALPPELMTVLLADASPTPALGHFSTPSPSSSVSWALELRPLPAGEPIAGHWRADNLVVAAERGYVNQQGWLWSPRGTLAALAYQVVTVYG